MAEKFWVLESPRVRTARWDSGNSWRKCDYCECSSDAEADTRIGFGGPANRLSELRVVLKALSKPNFAWTIPDCLIHEGTLQLLRNEGFTGFETRRASVRLEERSRTPFDPADSNANPDSDNDLTAYHELLVTGWGGVAPTESGVNRIPNTNIWDGYPDWSRIVDWDAWDGSDFFIVWPFGFTRLVTDRVAEFITKHNMTGARLITPDEYTRMHMWMQLSRTVPLRLRDHFPEERARAIGEPLGIY